MKLDELIFLNGCVFIIFLIEFKSSVSYLILVCSLLDKKM